MTLPLQTVEALLDECWLDTAQMCRLTGVSEAWLHEHAMMGVLQSGAHDSPATWRFDAAGLRRVQRLASLERDFDAVPELAALVADLEHELAQLRALLRRRGLG